MSLILLFGKIVLVIICMFVFAFLVIAGMTIYLLLNWNDID